MLEPLALARAVLTEDEMEAGVALIDIGGGTTDLPSSTTASYAIPPLFLLVETSSPTTSKRDAASFSAMPSKPQSAVWFRHWRAVLLPTRS